MKIPQAINFYQGVPVSRFEKIEIPRMSVMSYHAEVRITGPSRRNENDGFDNQAYLYPLMSFKK